MYGDSFQTRMRSLTSQEVAFSLCLQSLVYHRPDKRDDRIQSTVWDYVKAKLGHTDSMLLRGPQFVLRVPE